MNKLPSLLNGLKMKKKYFDETEISKIKPDHVLQVIDEAYFKAIISRTDILFTFVFKSASNSSYFLSYGIGRELNQKFVRASLFPILTTLAKERILGFGVRV